MQLWKTCRQYIHTPQPIFPTVLSPQTIREPSRGVNETDTHVTLQNRRAKEGINDARKGLVDSIVEQLMDLCGLATHLRR